MINESKKSTRISSTVQQGNQSNKKEHFDTLKRSRPSPDKQIKYSQKTSPNYIKKDQQGKSVRKDDEVPHKSERKSRKQLEDEAWIPQIRKSQSETPTRESRSRREKREKEEICPKCHHKKGRIRSKSSDQHLESRKVYGAVGIPKYDRDKEEMEVLAKYLRKENPHLQYIECSCAQTNIDFNRQFQFDTKRKSRANQRRNKFDF